MIDELISDDIVADLEAANITVGKVSASCSAIHQPSDVSPLFKAVKKRLSHCIQNEENVNNPVLEEHIRDALKTLESNQSIQVGSEYKNKIAYGCQCVVRALQDVTTPRLIRDGFQLCGQYPVNMEKVLHQSYKKITVSDYNLMSSATASDVEFFLEHGHLTEEQLDKSHIPHTSEDHTGAPRDEKALHNQRAALITHPNTIARYREYHNHGLPLANAITACSSANERKALKAAAKRQARKRKAAEKKEAELKRKQSMSPEEISMEKEAKRAVSAARKKKRPSRLRTVEQSSRKFDLVVI